MVEFLQQFSLGLQLGILYLIIVNLVTFFTFGIDKMKSRNKKKRRLSEKSLWILSLIGGSLGALAGMSYFRHKTQKISFQAGMAIILMVQILLIIFLLQP